ncbi:hypothetical protein TNCV_1366461 [Trichonephila clavipes]|nr:hypothetical protein TNCV_1366461 [Trichonephila clavipes]
MERSYLFFSSSLVARTYDVSNEEKFRFHRSHLFAGNIVEIVRIDTSSQVFVVFPTSTQAEFSTMGSNLYTGGTKFPKNGGASPPRTAFVHVPNFDQNRNFFNPGLYTGGVFMLSSNLYTG